MLCFVFVLFFCGWESNDVAFDKIIRDSSRYNYRLS